MKLRQLPFYALWLLIWFPFAAGQQHADTADFIQRMESEERVRKLQVDRVVEVLEVKPGQKVADIGAGSGLFSREFARKVGPEGVVFAVDVDGKLLEHIEKTTQEQGWENVRTVLAEEEDPRLPEMVDLIFLCDTLHHIENRSEYLSNLKDDLLPSGRVAIIDFSEDWPPGHEPMKYSLQDLEGWMSEAGYALEERFSFLEGNFFVVYTAP